MQAHRRELPGGRMISPKSRAQVPESAMTGGALESSQKPAGGPINVAGMQAPENRPDKPEGSGPPAGDPDSIMDTEQDAYARKRGYRNIDELLESRRG